MNMKISNNNISLAGEFAVLSQLALRGYDANLTLGHSKNVDILVSDPIRNVMYKLEVKTTIGANETPQRNLFGKTYEWVMNEKHEKVIDSKLFYCFVILDEDYKTSRFFIVPSKVVAPYVKIQHEFWMSRHKHCRETSMRKFRVGLEQTGYAIITPKAKRYENNWDFKK